ncbi:family 43 glycosylhydrolase [Microbacterium sp. NPDC096154]|uniref:glycoside hydrolase family 43 protein n=1 Tax=Microbacterium sp. NPDC096154 TaxID=3155549 RepID=UPI003319A19B
MTEVANPVLPGCHPDPSICRVGEWYYLVTSTFEYLPGLPVMRSRDLVRWQTIGHVIDREGMLDFDGIASSGGLYAPTIRHQDGVFWVVCTLVDQNDDTRGGNFVVTATDPAGPWSDPVWLDVEGIDPSVVFDDDGRVWMHGTRLARDPEHFHQTEVWVREYSPSARALVGPEHVIWRGAVRGAVWAEGPHLYRIDGRWHLVAAEGGTEYHHAVSVARADDIAGPFEGNRANPVLTHRHLGRSTDVIGAGHADLVQAPDGSWWAVLLAMRAADGHHYPLGRETFLCPVSWEDGWPVFAPGEGRVPRTVTLPWPVEAAPDGTWQPDDRAPGAVPPGDGRWTSLRALPEAVASDDADAWTLPARPATLADAAVVAFRGVRQQHADADVLADLDLSGLAEGESAGFVIRQSEMDHATVTLTRTGGRLVLRVVHRRAGEDILLHEERADAGAASVGVRSRGYRYELVRADAPGSVRVLAEVDARQLDAVATGGFLGVWFGVFATSHGEVPRGAVRVTRFHYAPA